MTPRPPHADKELSGTRLDFIVDVLIFQAKLFIGGFLGFLVGPVTLGAAALDLLFKSGPHGSRFYRVLDWCRKSEEFLGLYAALDQPHRPPAADDESDPEKRLR